MQLATTYIISQPFDMLTDIEKGWLRGSLWNNLYDRFKYENSKQNVFSSNHDKNMYALMVYMFACLEIKLYLLTHENDSQAREVYKKIEAEKNKLYAYYQSTVNF